MGRRLRQTVTALATTVLAAGAVVAVFYALPDGGAAETTAGTAPATSSASTSVTAGTSAGTGSLVTVSAPALETPVDEMTSAGAEQISGAETGSAAETADLAELSTTGTAAGTAAGGTADATGTTTAPPATSPAPPAAPQAPPPPSAPAPPAVTTAITTAAPKTTAPKTTAPATKTTAAKTTAPTTTAPKTTAPKTTAPAAPSFGVPVSVGNARQVITVAAASKSATSGTLRAWQQQSDGSWKVVFGPVKAWLGRQGIGTPSESASRTPQGTYTLTEAFGRLADPGTALPYRVTGANDWWVSDTRAASYNTWQTCAAASCPFNTKVSEHLHYITPYYDYAVVMDVNRLPVVPGGGSAFFLHVSVGAPTEGCVAIDKATLVDILRWLDPAQHPRIAVGVG